MRIALDAMGSDRAPAVEVEGAVGALLERADLRMVLVGDRAAIEAELERFPGAPRDRIEVLHASETIRMDESPVQAVRRKPDSSIVRGLRLQKEGSADAFVSAGSTGATMAASLLILRTLEGVDRPPVAAALPAPDGRFLLLDMGANVDLKPVHFVQFAHLGAIYARDLMGIANPRVGLLNIGEEAEKGNEQTTEAHRLLRASPGIDFIGNVEGREIIGGKCDVLVCDGFVGNVLLKFYESVAGFMADLLRHEMEEQKCYLDLTPMYRKLDYTEWGGAPLLGIRGVTFICHGGSPPRAIQNAILAAATSVERGLVEHMARRLAAAGQSGSDG
jgi:phosphate acyltransferase